MVMRKPVAPNMFQKKLLEEWATKDPIAHYQNYLLEEGMLTENMISTIRKELATEIDEHWNRANDEPLIESNTTIELSNVFQKHEHQIIEPSLEKEYIRFIDAISQGLKQAMERHPELVIMGQDIAEYGGVFKITDGFMELFGKRRVRNTPICESAIVSAAYGLSINGIKSVVEMQFADFVTSGFNPIVNLLAKSHYRWSQNADVVIRMPCGGGVGAGPFHSQTNEAWFTKTPGLKVVYPAFPYDAKGLLATAINDPNPVLFFEHKGLYRSIRQDVPTDYYTLPLGKASFLQEGDNLTIIAYGAAVHWVLEVLEVTPMNADVIDLRCLQPLDTDAIYASAKKTGKVLIVHEDSMFGSISSDISSLIHENCFEYLDAPVKRVASLETPIPFEPQLEKQYMAKDRLSTSLNELLNY